MARRKKVRRATTVLSRNAGTWTEAEYFGKIRSSLRNIFRYWKPMTLALDRASRPYVGKNKLQKKEYLCNSCKKWFKRSEVEVDHIIPCGSLRSLSEIEQFVKNLTSENLEDYQVLCKDVCHLNKTLKEKELRKIIKNKL